MALMAAALLLGIGVTSCGQGTDTPHKKLSDARHGFKTVLTRKDKEDEVAPPPPPTLFNLVQYESPAGKLEAYVGIDPKDGKKHPAIIWLVGGFSNCISEVPWEKMPADNDQSAAAFRKAGLVMMYPSLRGGNQNPGFKEGFLGEVDDVLGALSFLKKLDYVDPTRIYLGGHSTGATLALLAAEMTPDFRAVIAFGPVHNPVNYGDEYMPFNVRDKQEVALRSPILWMQDITSPTVVIEGSDGNAGPLLLMKRKNSNPKLSFHKVDGATHFSVLRPLTTFMAAKFMADTGPTANVRVTGDELAKAYQAGH